MSSNIKPTKRIAFIEMMGIPGSYDASVYAHLEDKDDEGLWFTKRFAHVSGISIKTHNVCIGEPLPTVNDVDGLVLAGSYNSVHDHTHWQQKMRKWIPQMRQHEVPILGICGSHQLMANIDGSDVQLLTNGPFAGTFPIELTAAGEKCPIMQGIQSNDSFHYANNEHVIDVPKGSTLLAASSKVPIAALDFGNHCYSTQFHPEGSRETLGTVWRYSNPELMHNYHNMDKGDLLVENFLQLVINL